MKIFLIHAKRLPDPKPEKHSGPMKVQPETETLPIVENDGRN